MLSCSRSPGCKVHGFVQQQLTYQTEWPCIRSLLLQHIHSILPKIELAFEKTTHPWTLQAGCNECTKPFCVTCHGSWEIQIPRVSRGCHSNRRLLYYYIQVVKTCSRLYLSIFSSKWFTGASTLDTMLFHVPRVCTSFMLFIFIMQLYWFGLMVRGAAKMLKGKSGKTNRKAEKSSWHILFRKYWHLALPRGPQIL